ncbi:ComEC/Rec2 family competence protein [Aminobacter sp. DSM 101952]|uniref:ComEC/Rec2 family competence protein n=1 Tax=Aminobacter sp. DSM 101952 TaxID=2735891 RepID=UPI0009E87932|nr:ComEC/Rec2 family competence protein [Aminobacter sp. DSM 101952]
MGERVREGETGNNPVVETGERALLGGAAVSSVAWVRPTVPSAEATEIAVVPVPQPYFPRLPAWSGAAASVRSSTRAMRVAIETELERGAAFLLVPVFLAIGALGYFSFHAEPPFAPLVTAFGLLAVLAFLMRTNRLAHYALAAAAICLLGMAMAKIETDRMATRMLGATISAGITGRVVEIDSLDNGRQRLTLDILATERPVLRYAPDRVRLTARKLPDGVTAGSLVTGYARLMPPSGPVRPGSYDFSFESYFDGIGASGFFMKGPELVASTDPLPATSQAAAWVANARDRIAQRIRDRVGGAEGEIAAALVVGVRGGIPEDVNEALRRTGLYHIISISGLHMAMVAGTVMLLTRLAFAAFPAFASRRPVKKYAASAALAATGGYLFISGAEVAAQRSFIMLAVMLTAVLFDRAALTMRNLAISAIVVIVISPHEVVGPSFQMSFAATAALVGAYAWWSDRREQQAQPVVQRSLPSKLWRWLATVAAGLVATSLIAGLATSVFGAWHFQRISPLSLVANLAVMPIVSVLVMPFAVLAGLFMPLRLDGIFLDTMGAGLTAMIALATWFSERSPVDAVGLMSTHSVVLVTLALVIGSMATTWLRLAALPIATLALLLLMNAEAPDAFVSEDARLVGVPVGEGKLAVNRTRPSQFTVDNWKRALVSEDLIGPARVAPASAANPKQNIGQGGSGRSGGDAAFSCTDGLCLIEHPSGMHLAHAENAAAARRACGIANLVVVNDATARNPCGNAAVVVLTSRALARLGSAAIFLRPAQDGARQDVEIRHAVATPYRPWHVQRAFSREARGLPPYRRDSRRPGASEPASPAR